MKRQSDFNESPSVGRKKLQSEFLTAYNQFLSLDLFSNIQTRKASDNQYFFSLIGLDLFSRISISCIEHLPNELFYEIFEYLDGCDIYKAFSNLNSRFQYMITNSLLSLKIKIRPNTISELMQLCQNIILPNRHCILSLYLENKLIINDFFTYCIIGSSFNRLNQLLLEALKPTDVRYFFFI